MGFPDKGTEDRQLPLQEKAVMVIPQWKPPSLRPTFIEMEGLRNEALKRGPEAKAQAAQRGEGEAKERYRPSTLLSAQYLTFLATPELRLWIHPLRRNSVCSRIKPTWEEGDCLMVQLSGTCVYLPVSVRQEGCKMFPLNPQTGTNECAPGEGSVWAELCHCLAG